jgi:Tfp pilus assembly protein PilF
LFGRARGIAPLAVLFAGLGAFWAVYDLRHSSPGTAVHGSVGPLHYLLAQIQVVASYLRLLVWPAGLSVDHDFQAASPVSLYAIYCSVILVAALGAAIFVRRTKPTVSFLALTFFIFLAPTSSIIPSADLMFEHRMYLPMIAASILVAWGLFAACGTWMGGQRTQQAVSLVLLCALLAGYGMISKHRTWIWGDNIRLWTDAASGAPRKVRARYNLGVAYLPVSRQKAREEFLEVLRLAPDHAAALYNLGWLDQTEGRFDSARRYYLSTIRANAQHWQAHQNLANLSVLHGNLQEAIQEYRETIRLRPDYWPAYQSLAALQLQNGDAVNALATLKRLKELRPDQLEVRYLNAYALIENRRFAEAEEELAFIGARDSAGTYKLQIAELRRRMSSR